MKAVVFTGDQEEIRAVPEPVVGPGEALIKVAFCGICGSDLHAATGDFRPGTVMGHEFSGTVVAVAEDVDDWVAGDRVVVNPNGGWCGVCDQCQRGHYNLCPQVWDSAVGLTVSGGLAPLVAVASRMLRRIPDSLSLRHAALVEPLAVALRTVRRSEFRIGESAIVFGGGTIGLLVASLLRSAGADEVTVVEPSTSRRAAAEIMGATRTVDPNGVEAVVGRQEMPAFGFDCTGVPSIPAVALRSIAPRGRLTITGYSRKPPEFDAADLLFGEREVRGSFIYVEEFSQAITLLASGAVNVEPLISDVVTVAEAETAFAAMRDSADAFKYLISDIQGQGR